MQDIKKEIRACLDDLRKKYPHLSVAMIRKAAAEVFSDWKRKREEHE